MWQNVVQFYQDTFGIPPKAVMLFCSFEILELIAKGNCNESISEDLGIEIEEVKEISSRYYGFDGWTEDLEFFPMLQYPRYTNKYAYTQAITFNKPWLKAEALISWEVVEKFKKLEKEFYSYK